MSAALEELLEAAARVVLALSGELEPLGARRHLAVVVVSLCGKNWIRACYTECVDACVREAFRVDLQSRVAFSFYKWHDATASDFHCHCFAVDGTLVRVPSTSYVVGPLLCCVLLPLFLVWIGVIEHSNPKIQFGYVAKESRKPSIFQGVWHRKETFIQPGLEETTLQRTESQRM